MEQILRGELRPGDRLVELRIAAQMETSQAPVREALRELEALGLVETLHNRGARVRIISDAELREIYDVRAQLEGFAAECAARTGCDLRARLEREIRHMRKAAEAADSRRFSEHNSNFHRIIVRAAENATLTGLWEGLNIKSRTMLNVVRHPTDLIAVTVSHEPLVDALSGGDAERARRAAIEHVLMHKP
ncbi:MAG: GntR family transcriptional regulator [Alphaproteobacteria bacterium]|nr:MAG: GntR family transcriptional regulator [Alphaproteobacteria bacterium]